MKYTISWCEVKKTGETNGREWKITEMTLKDEAGNEHEKVSTFDAVMSGQTIDGDISINDKGYKNFKTAPSPKAVAGANFKAKQIEETMQRKETSIGKFQDNKEWSIMVTSSMNKAIELAIAEYGNGLAYTYGETLGENIKGWRNWIITNWEVDKTDTPAF